jgi:hypothetical protein
MFQTLITRLATTIIIGFVALNTSVNAARAAVSTQAVLAQAVTDIGQIDATTDVIEEDQVASWAVRLIGLSGFAVLFVVGWMVARASHNRQQRSSKYQVASSKKKISKKSTQLKTKKTVKKTRRRSR